LSKVFLSIDGDTDRKNMRNVQYKIVTSIFMYLWTGD